MRYGFLALLVAALALLSPDAALAKSFTVQKVRGDLEATDTESDAKGKFSIVAVTSGDGGGEKLIVLAKGLDEDVEYEVLLGESVDDAASFGEMKVRGKKGYGWFKFSSRQDDYPDDVDSLTDFSGEKLFVVADDETVLEGDIPEIVDPGSDDEAGEGSFAYGGGYDKLTPPDDSDSKAIGLLKVAAMKTPRGSREVLTVAALWLEKGDEYDVYVVGEDGGDDEKLGTMEARGFFGIALLFLDTKRGDELPDSLADLAERTIEVRDADDEVVLTGEFPTID